MPFLRQKYSHSVLSRGQSLTNNSLETYQLVIRTAPFSASTLHRSDDFVFLQIQCEQTLTMRSIILQMQLVKEMGW